jgi:hypothetical protein
VTISRDFGEVKVDSADAGGDLRGTLRTIVSEAHERGSGPVIAASVLRFEGPFVAHSCGPEPSRPGTSRPPRASAQTPRPEPGLRLTIAGHVVPVLGAVLRPHGAYSILELSSAPLDCTSEGEPEFAVTIALRGGAPTGASVRGARMPMQVGDHVNGGSYVRESRDDAGTSLDLDVGFGPSSGYRMSVSGKVHPLTCEK